MDRSARYRQGAPRVGRCGDGSQPDLFYGGAAARAPRHCRDYPRAAVQSAAGASGEDVAGVAENPRSRIWLKALYQLVTSAIQAKRLPELSWAGTYPGLFVDRGTQYVRFV